MSGLLVGGDRPLLPHLLPPVPTITRRINGPGAALGFEQEFPLVNAVAQCARCDWLFVSREDPDGWGRVVRWVRLRWWHRTAWRKLRERLEA